jgi:hypothetical protein
MCSFRCYEDLPTCGEGGCPLRLLIISYCQNLVARRCVDVEIENGGRSADRGASETSKV